MKSYTVLTWDYESQSFTPQDGVPEIVHGPCELRAALRTLRSMGYEGCKGDPSVLIHAIPQQTLDFAGATDE